MIIGIALFLLRVAVMAAIAGFILMLIAPFTADRKPDYAESFKAMFIAFLCQAFVDVGLVFALDGMDETAATGIAALVGFLVLTIVLAYQIEATLPRAALTAVALIAIGVAIGLGIRAATASMRGEEDVSRALPAVPALRQAA